MNYYELLNGDVVDLDIISCIGGCGGFGATNSCFYTGYTYRVYNSEKEYLVSVSCEKDTLEYEKIEKQVDDEFFYIKRYLLNKKAIATGISI